MTFQTNLTLGLLSEGGKWIEHWATIPSPAPKRWDNPPMGAAGEAVITYAWGVEALLYFTLMRAKLEAGEITPEVFAKGAPVWKELGSDEALTLAATLPDKYRQGVTDRILYSRYAIRRVYRHSRPGTASIAWAPPPDLILPGGGGDEGPASLGDDFLDWLGFNPAVGVAALIWPITIFGIASVAAGAWYGSKRAEAGVLVEAEAVSAMAQAWRDAKVASIQASQGQPITVPDWVSSGAAIERAQTSPWFIGGVGLLAGGAAVGSAAYALTRKKRNPRRRRRNAVVAALPPAANPRRRKKRKAATKRKTTKRRNAAPALATANPRRKKRKATTKRRKKRNPTHAAANPKKRRKASKKPSKATFIASQRRKGRSSAQAEAAWKLTRPKMRAKAKRGRKKAA